MLHVNFLFRTLWIQRYRNDWHFAPHLAVIFSAEKCLFEPNHCHSAGRRLLDKHPLEPHSCPTSSNLTAPDSVHCVDLLLQTSASWFPVPGRIQGGEKCLELPCLCRVCHWTKHGLVSMHSWHRTPGAGMCTFCWIWTTIEQNAGIRRT